MASAQNGLTRFQVGSCKTAQGGHEEEKPLLVRAGKNDWWKTINEGGCVGGEDSMDLSLTTRYDRFVHLTGLHSENVARGGAKV